MTSWSHPTDDIIVTFSFIQFTESDITIEAYCQSAHYNITKLLQKMVALLLN